MSGQFKVGEVCVGQKFYLSPEYNGVECVILNGPTEKWSTNDVTRIRTFETFYDAQWADGLIFNVRPKNLRRKQPPSGEQSVMELFKAPQPKRMGEPA